MAAIVFSLMWQVIYMQSSLPDLVEKGQAKSYHIHPAGVTVYLGLYAVAANIRCLFSLSRLTCSIVIRIFFNCISIPGLV